MKVNALRRWTHPRVILVISTLAEGPAHTLRVISGLRATGARVFLVQLPAATPINYRPGRNIPFLISTAPKLFELGSGHGASQALLWAEILSGVTVLRITPVERIPALADSLGADMAVLTTADIAWIPVRNGDIIDDLMGSLPVPVLVCDARMLKMGAWNSREIRRILVPVAFGPALDLQLRFACRFARRHHGRLTVLHVFEHPAAGGAQAWQRTPVAVEAKLPIAELKQEGIMCPMEVAVSAGYPERKIVSFSEEKRHNLILMASTRKRNAFAPSRAGVTEAVLAQAQCPVLVLGSAITAASASVAEVQIELSTA